MPTPCPGESSTPRRKRVAKACETCRAMKSRCDGKRPFCGRCDGYGYKCVYSTSGRNRRGPDMDGDWSRTSQENVSAPTMSTSKADEMKVLLVEYQALLRDIAPKIASPGDSGIPESIQSINARTDAVLQGLKSMSTGHIQVVIQPNSARTPSDTPRPKLEHSPRYLGDVSDVKFFNLVNRVLSTSSEQVDGENMDSYEHDDDGDAAAGSDPVPADSITISMPPPEVADAYMDVYFSTIHVAYPFIPKRSFMKSYLKLRDFKDADGIDRCRLATLFIIFAIGAYYLSFPGKTNSLHDYYYNCAVSLFKTDCQDRSIEQVTSLLARCFYLLTVSRTDQCWTTLGLAVRHAQTIGLHVEHEEPRAPTKQGSLRAERRRRLWFSLYVLDRLLSLQLGRPTAVHEEDCDLALPSRVDDADIDWEDEGTLPEPSDGPSAGDYFLQVIKLSGLIGRTLRNLYSPQKAKSAAERLSHTAALDQELLEWKRNLPRALRFDLGHAFENSTTFRRQRNMLAIKFHHLRALIHRPYLFIPLNQNVEQGSVAALQNEGHRFAQYERICVAEARETAHLLHNVSDEKDLVHDFPWWQMISCLICASSILVVASVFAQRSSMRDAPWDFDADALNDDAETCMKAFEALSIRSDGARLARDMTARLKQRGQAWCTLTTTQTTHLFPGAAARHRGNETAHHLALSGERMGLTDLAAVTGNSDAQSQMHFQPPLMRVGENGHRQDHEEHVQAQLHGAAEEPLPQTFLSQAESHAGMLGTDLLTMPTDFQLQEEWPPEIADSMVWSAQFVNPLEGIEQDFPLS